MAPPNPPCPRCGGMEYRSTGPEDSECVDCGLGRRTVMVTASFSGPPAAPAPETRRHLDELRARSLAVLDHPPFPLVGLDDRWLGPRSLGGHGGSEDIEHVTLTHGDGMVMTGPLVRVETHHDRRFPLEVARHMEAESLVQALAMSTGHMRDDVRAAAYPRDGVVGDPMAPWDEVALPIDAVDIPFRVLADGEHWVALGLGDRVISIVARSWPIEGTGLVTITDFDAYRAGTEEQFRRFG